MKSTIRYTAAALLCAAGAASAQVQQIHPLYQIGDLLIGDTGGSKILRAHDGNQNGNYSDAGELFVYFDPAVAVDPNTNLPYGASKLTNPVAMAMDMKANVYVVDSASTRTMFKLRDLNGDGDANDLGESSIFFDATNAAGWANFSMQGVVCDEAGNVIITTQGQGTGFANNDRIFKLVDVNNDGDANDMAETTVLYDRNTAFNNGAVVLDGPAWIGAMGDGNLYVTNGFSSSQGAWRLVDQSVPPNGRFDDIGDIVGCYNGFGGNPIPNFTWCARFGQDGRFYLLNNTAKKVIASTDISANYIYDDTTEALTFAASGVGGITWTSAFGFEARPDGAILVGDQGGSPNNRLLLYKDLNGNNNAMDAGEQSVLLSFSTSAFPTAKPRSLLYLPIEPSTFGTALSSSLGVPPVLEWVRDGGIAKIGSPSFTMKVSNLFPGGPVYLFYADATYPIFFDTLLPGICDPACILYPSIFSAEFNAIDYGPADGAGELIMTAGLNGNPALAGLTFTAQVMSVDLIAGTPLIFSNALLVPIL